jgi:hypothetical protein
MEALVAPLSTAAQVCQRDQEPNAVERSQHMLKRPLVVNPVDLKQPLRSEGVLVLLGRARVVDRLSERK